jgi:UDP-3-O-[3-hydroxymyristoyl] N-acetylglucosamine deacetylase
MPAAGEVVLEGVGLHTGAPARVLLMPRKGPVTLRSSFGVGGPEARIDELRVARTARATTVEGPGPDGLRVGTVEHAFAALAGLGVHEGVVLAVEGPEMPLLDGTARDWCDALARIGAPMSGPRLRVARAAAFDVGPSSYEFAPGADGHLVDIEVRLELDDARIDPVARWTGDAADFRDRIAPARTFATAGDLPELARRGLARHVPPTAVIVLTPDEILCAGRPFAADEPARHKLLDMLGDLYLHGGPPAGRLRAVRPGHAANARAFARARDEGILVPIERPESTT